NFMIISSRLLVKARLHPGIPLIIAFVPSAMPFTTFSGNSITNIPTFFNMSPVEVKKDLTHLGVTSLIYPQTLDSMFKNTSLTLLAIVLTPVENDSIAPLKSPLNIRFQPSAKCSTPDSNATNMSIANVNLLTRKAKAEPITLNITSANCFNPSYNVMATLFTAPNSSLTNPKEGKRSLILSHKFLKAVPIFEIEFLNGSDFL